MITRKLLLSSVSVIAILVFSTVFVAIPITPRASAQAQLPREQRNWEHLNYNAQSTNFNPQTLINKDNVELLEMKWIFPIPGSSASKFSPSGGQGSTTPPLIVDGIVYIGADYGVVYALDAKSGKQLWSTAIEFNFTATKELLPLHPLATVSAHWHGIRYIDGKIWLATLGCSFSALDALTGKIVFQVKNICKDIPGNAGFYNAAAGSHPPMIVKRDNVIIWGIGSGNEGRVGGRAFVAGFDLNTGSLLWRFFLAPPVGGDPDWAVRVADKGWIHGIKASEILARCPDCLKNDWGQMPNNQGMSNLWGSWAVDEDTGIAYIGTSQAGPDYNATFRPGPNLFGSSVVALKAKTGELVWFYQTTTHDMWDYDCSWNTILGTVGNKKVVFKGCKNGVVHALDAATGAPLWTYRGENVKYCDYCHHWVVQGPHVTTGAGGRDLFDLFTYRQTHREASIGAVKTGLPSTFHWMNCQPSGCLESDTAFDGKRVYATIMNNPTWSRTGNAPTQKQALAGGRDAVDAPGPTLPVMNATLYALDAATGRVVWSFFVPGVGFRGGLMVSGGIVFMHSPDGNLYMIDAETGKLVSKKFFGQGLLVEPTIGATADGQMRVYLVFGNVGFGAAGQAVPGALMSFGLPEKIPQPQVITKEVVKEVPKEVIKEVVKEVPKEVIKEVVKEVVKEVPKEVVKEVPKEVIKEVTKTVTVETISPVSYAAIGIGIVLVVVAGVMMSRRKKV